MMYLRLRPSRTISAILPLLDDALPLVLTAATMICNQDEPIDEVPPLPSAMMGMTAKSEEIS